MCYAVQNSDISKRRKRVAPWHKNALQHGTYARRHAYKGRHKKIKTPFWLRTLKLFVTLPTLSKSSNK